MLRILVTRPVMVLVLAGACMVSTASESYAVGLLRTLIGRVTGRGAGCIDGTPFAGCGGCEFGGCVLSCDSYCGYGAVTFPEYGIGGGFAGYCDTGCYEGSIVYGGDTVVGEVVGETVGGLEGGAVIEGTPIESAPLEPTPATTPPHTDDRSDDTSNGDPVDRQPADTTAPRDSELEDMNGTEDTTRPADDDTSDTLDNGGLNDETDTMPPPADNTADPLNSSPADNGVDSLDDAADADAADDDGAGDAGDALDGAGADIPESDTGPDALEGAHTDHSASRLSPASVVQSISELPLRHWTDASGQFSTEGRLVETTTSYVRLLKTNGRYARVPLDRLSKADRAYVDSMTTQSAM